VPVKIAAMPLPNLAGRLAVCVVTTARPGPGHAALARLAAAGGADAVQLRAPELEDGALLPLAAEVAAACHAAGVLCMVNNRLEVALEAGADGVHLGQEDDYGTARRRLGRGRLLGVSLRAPDQLAAAEAAGADYVGVTVFATATKSEAHPVGLEGVRAVAGAARVPVVGIGGIAAGNAGQVIRAGATAVAVVSAVAAATDVRAATQELVAVVRRAKEGRS
jgi:thiamine-phosphate pyrophosphorylase